MKRFFGDSIGGRIGLVLLIGLTVSHVLSVALYFTNRTNALISAGEEHVGERVATVVRLMEKAPESECARILEYLQSPNLRITRTVQNVVQPSLLSDWKTDVLRNSLFTHFQKIGSRDFKVRYIERDAQTRENPVAGRPNQDENNVLVSNVSTYGTN